MVKDFDNLLKEISGDSDKTDKIRANYAPHSRKMHHIVQKARLRRSQDITGRVS